MMTYEATISKIYRLPVPLLQEVNDFVDFLLTRSDNTRWQMWTQFAESLELAELGMVDYLSNLEDYEHRLARGEIQW